ncbi:trace amine-associated receptor 13c-like [Carassius auratus]|uniref:Trace amine-associated receptor 13c-like n=1 Tax=Carassius auratus TaxID=7957 RepID=A0A6P6KTW7_CARAU|nr:trace amine-associated receptor 13c-like [Carassius auratus]
MAYETEDHEIQYCFPAINSSCIKGKHSSHEYNIMYMFFSLLSVWTVFLNLLVIISISHFKKLHTPTNLIILSLAVADMLVGLVMPLEALRLIEMCWYFGDTFCGLYLIFIAVLFSASLSNLILIAVDRYVALCHPLLYQQKITTTKTLIIICICWMWSSAYNVSFITDNRNFYPSSRTHGCYGECPFMANSAWSMADLLLSFLLPCTVIIILYLKIFYVVHQQVKVINSLMKSGKCIKEGSARRKSESKAALTLGIIVSVYLLCYIPYYILSLALNTVISFKIVRFLIWIVYINSGLNPLVYALFYRWFKVSVKHILTLKILKTASSLIDIFTDYNQSL